MNTCNRNHRRKFTIIARDSDAKAVKKQQLFKHCLFIHCGKHSYLAGVFKCYTSFSLFFDSETSENTSVRLIFNGQELRGDRTLQSYNVEDRCVIHCLLSRSPAPERNNTVEQGIPFDMGNLVFPLFGLILGLIWYCRVMYRAYFNAMSTFSLVGITFLYVVALMASFRPNRNHEHVH